MWPDEERHGCRCNKVYSNCDCRCNVPWSELKNWDMIFGFHEECARVAANGVKSLDYPLIVNLLSAGWIIIVLNIISTIG